MSMTFTEEFVTRDSIKSAERCLIDNGIEPDEAEIVLQAIWYILMGEELYYEDDQEDCEDDDEE